MKKQDKANEEWRAGHSGGTQVTKDAVEIVMG